MKSLLKLLRDKGKLKKGHQQELDELSDSIASYEEEYFAFEPVNLIEMIELRMSREN